MSDEVLFTFESTHKAVAAERLLERDGFTASVAALPSALGADCGFCLRIRPEDAAAALGLLTDSRLKPQGIYRQQDGGYLLWKP